MSQLSIDEKEGTTDNPLVSIITPVLNGARYLAECIQSVLRQSYPHIEHIFVDGGSSDGTLDILTSYKARYHDRIRFISEPDRGPGEAWNKGIIMAKGEILGWLGSDDTYEPDAIQTIVEFLRVNPDACFVFGDANYIDENGEVIKKAPNKDFNLQETINDVCYIPTPSAFYRREVIKKVGLLDIKGNDLDFWIRVGKKFQIYRIEKLLSNFRLRQGQASSKGTLKMQFREAYITSRRHGGRLLSPRGARYFIYSSSITVWLVPILRPVYHFINKMLRRE